VECCSVALALKAFGCKLDHERVHAELMKRHFDQVLTIIKLVAIFDDTPDDCTCQWIATKNMNMTLQGHWKGGKGYLLNIKMNLEEFIHNNPQLKEYLNDI
jgi:hypothetical protein